MTLRVEARNRRTKAESDRGHDPHFVPKPTTELGRKHQQSITDALARAGRTVPSAPTEDEVA